MANSINLQINQAKRDIVNAINNTNLPISIIRLIIDALAEEVRETEMKVLEQEVNDGKNDNNASEVNDANIENV